MKQTSTRVMVVTMFGYTLGILVPILDRSFGQEYWPSLVAGFLMYVSARWAS